MNQRKIGIVLNYISKVIQIMLRILGQSEYGTYQLVYSTISYLSILSLGLTGAYNRFYYRYKVKNDEKAISKLNGLFLSVFIVIAIISIICGGFIYLNIEIILGDKLLESEIVLAKKLMIFMIFNLALTFPASVFDCNIVANERFFFQKMLVILQGLMGPFITLPLLLLGYGSIGIILITTILTFLKFVVSIYYCVIKLKMRFSIGKIDWALLAELMHFSVYLLLGQIVEIVNWNVDNFLIGRFLGAIPVAIYGVGSQINNLYLQLSTSISSVFAPKINELAAQTDDNKELNVLFIRMGRIQFIVLLLVLLEFILWGEDFICLWVGKEYAESFMVAVLLIIPVTIPLIQNIGLEILYAKNMHKVRAVVQAIIAVVNIVFSIILINIMGVVGAALGTGIALLLGNVIFMNYYYQFKVGLDIKKFWLGIIEFVPTIVVVMVVGNVVKFFCRIENWFGFFINAAVIIIIYGIALYCLTLNQYEKELFYSLLKPLRKKSSK